MGNCFTRQVASGRGRRESLEKIQDVYTTVERLKIRYWSNSKASNVDDEKPRLVFFHGYSFSIDNWKSIGTLDLLSKQGYSVYAVDLPSGKATKSDKMWREKKMDYIPVLEKIFESIGLRSLKASGGPIVLVGPSMGGGFALAYALAHPKEVSALVLISPSVKSLEDEDLNNLKMPVLLLWGDKDNVFPVEEYGRSLKKSLVHSRLVILRNAGHAAYLEKPDEFHEILSEFLDEIS